jgi:hypothetical protein
VGPSSALFSPPNSNRADSRPDAERGPGDAVPDDEWPTTTRLVDKRHAEGFSDESEDRVDALFGAGGEVPEVTVGKGRATDTTTPFVPGTGESFQRRNRWP